MGKKNIILLIAVCLVSLLMGFVIGQTFKGTIDQKDENQQELVWCKSALEMFYPPLPEEIYYLGGTVIEIEDSFLVMESNVQINQFPLPNQEHFEVWKVKVNLTDQTEVFKREMVEELIIPEQGEEPVDPFQKVFLSVDDIEIGESINIFSEENIKSKKEFFANQIELY